MLSQLLVFLQKNLHVEFDTKKRFYFMKVTPDKEICYDRFGMTPMHEVAFVLGEQEYRAVDQNNGTAKIYALVEVTTVPVKEI